MAATHAISKPTRHNQWYDEDLTEVNPQIRSLLETYSKVPPERVVPHVNAIVRLNKF
jgi:hypothetical protein